MPVRLRSYSTFLIVVCLVLTVGLTEAGAQTKKKKRRHSSKPAPAKPVITNPTIAPPATTGAAPASGDVKIISTADANNATGATESSDQLQGWKPKVTTPPTPGSESSDQQSSPDKEGMQQTITNLSNQVNRLNDKLTQMQDDDRYQLDMERLTRAEQRAEQLRMQLLDTQSKIADVEARLEQIDYALRPENIDRATQGYGSTRPEEARDSRKRQLENEQSRLKAQLKLLETSQSRLEVSVANADNEVDTLRAKMQQRRDQMDAVPPRTANPRKPE